MEAEEKVHAPQGVSCAGSLLVVVGVAAAVGGGQKCMRVKREQAISLLVTAPALVPSLRLTTKDSRL